MRRLVEIVWMAIAAISIVEGYLSYKATGFSKDTQVFVFVFAVSAFMYFLRKRQRVKLQQMKKEIDNNVD